MENISSKISENVSPKSNYSENINQLEIDQIEIGAGNQTQSPQAQRLSSNHANKNETMEFSRLLDKMQGDKEQRKRLEEIISYLKVR